MPNQSTNTTAKAHNDSSLIYRNDERQDVRNTMPPKRSSNNNKKKKSKKESPSNEAISNWIQGSRVNAKGLSKKLPGLAEGIRDGSIDSKDVPKRVQTAQKEHFLSEIQKALGKLGPDFPKNITRLDSLQIMTGGEQLLCDLCRVACGSNEKLIHPFAHDFFVSKMEKWGSVEQTVQNCMDNADRTDMDWDLLDGIRDKVLNSGDVSSLNAEELSYIKENADTFESNFKPVDLELLLDVQKSFDLACEKWQSEIEKFTKKPLGEFCWAYKVSPFAFLEKCMFLMERSKNFSLESLAEDFAFTQTIEKQQDKKVEAAVRGIKAGWDTVRNQCWECGKVDSDVKKCSQCQAARYCSKECQLNSWRSGHKHACAALKLTYEHFTENYSRVNKALALQDEKAECPMYPGCHLAPAGSKDYVLLPFMMLNEIFPIQPCPCERPTIDYMYKSLASLVSGEHHWMFMDTFRGTLQEYIHATVIERATKQEMTYVRYGLLCLGLDLSTAKPAYDLDRFVHQMRNFLKSNSDSGELMPVSRFIGIYYRFGMAHKEGYEDPLIRNEALAKCFTIMTKCVHKTANVDMENLIEVMNKFNSKK